MCLCLCKGNVFLFGLTPPPTQECFPFFSWKHFCNVWQSFFCYLLLVCLFLLEGLFGILGSYNHFNVKFTLYIRFIDDISFLHCNVRLIFHWILEGVMIFLFLFFWCQRYMPRASYWNHLRMNKTIKRWEIILNLNSYIL